MSAGGEGAESPAGAGRGLRIFVLDNYDSFTYNLVQYLAEMEAEVEVARNDAVGPGEVVGGGWDGIVISPGPGEPSAAGISEALIREAAGRTPLLGVCLGHQALGEVYGAEVVRAGRLMHGKTSLIHHAADEIHAGVENPFEATRYHSLVLRPDSVREPLALTAWTDHDEVMGVRHASGLAWGVQYHPESILTRPGRRLLANFLSRCRERAGRP